MASDDRADDARAILVAAEVAARALLESARLDAAHVEAEAAAHDPLTLFVEAGCVRHRARVEATRAVRDVREETYERALALLRARLAALRADPGYPALFRALVEEGLKALPSACVLRIDPRDAHLLSDLGLPALAIHETLTTHGGVVLDSDDGRTVRNTFEDRLARSEERLRSLVEGALKA